MTSRICNFQKIQIWISPHSLSSKLMESVRRTQSHVWFWFALGKIFSTLKKYWNEMCVCVLWCVWIGLKRQVDWASRGGGPGGISRRPDGPEQGGCTGRAVTKKRAQSHAVRETLDHVFRTGGHVIALSRHMHLFCFSCWFFSLAKVRNDTFRFFFFLFIYLCYFIYQFRPFYLFVLSLADSINNSTTSYRPNQDWTTRVLPSYLLVELVLFSRPTFPHVSFKGKKEIKELMCCRWTVSFVSRFHYRPV